MKPPAFCANVLSTCRGQLEREPDGFWLCETCRNDVRRAAPVIRDYDCDDVMPSASLIRRATSKLERSLDRRVPKTSRPGAARKASPGFIVVRVKRKSHDGTPLDAATAMQTLRDRPWFRELVHIGSDPRFHLFERPDDKAAAKARQSHDRVDVLAPYGGKDWRP